MSDNYYESPIQITSAIYISNGSSGMKDSSKFSKNEYMFLIREETDKLERLVGSTSTVVMSEKILLKKNIAELCALLDKYHGRGLDENLRSS